ncbi:hypothetical protein [Allorhizobium sonneratiae]|uniref:hypothetical protein n=1 Tax=Allorhizobium sonneratiae TaxID=2934936 RepID=UPI002033AD43|nr:hypothetical protein [Allorhizobium sonneratiae]
MHLQRLSGLADQQGASYLLMLLQEGGDQRIHCDPLSGRNRYGTRCLPDPQEIGFSSTTASTVSPSGFALSLDALSRFDESDAEGWFDHVRRRLGRCFELGAEQVVLSPSGTDAELMAVSLYAGLSRNPVSVILIAPDETGSGVAKAAAGCHFSSLTALGVTVEAGQPVSGFPVDRQELMTIAIRDMSGRARPTDEIDSEVLDAVKAALKRGRDVVLHVLDTSKTGLSGVSRPAARAALALDPERVGVIVDACQFRCRVEEIAEDVQNGFLVIVTGSKFLAGPPFSAALLLPERLRSELLHKGGLPQGLADYSADLDWPSDLRGSLGFHARSKINLGLGLRWIAPLSHLEALTSVTAEVQAEIKAHFLALIRQRLAVSRHVVLHEDDEGDYLSRRAIIPLSLFDTLGHAVGADEARRIWQAMREDGCGPVCQIGQPVILGERVVVRLAASAADVLSLAEGLTSGQSLSQAAQPVETRLDRVFDKLERLLSRQDGC